MKSDRIKFSVPYNGDYEIVEYFIENKKFISDVYFGLPHKVITSGRIIDYNFKSSDYLKNLPLALKKLKENGIKCSLVMNRSCDGEMTFSPELVQKYKEIIRPLVNENLIDNVVLSNPVYFTELKKEYPLLTFSISVNSNINSIYRAKFIDQLGFDIIIVDRDINHNEELIKNISNNVSAKIKLLVNECCLNECLFRTYHFNLLSHHQGDIAYHKILPCTKIYSKEPWKMLKSSFILPKDLDNYDDFVDIFKLAGRELPTKLLKHLLEIYFHRKNEGDLLTVLSSYGLHVWKNEFIKKHNKIPYLQMDKLPKNFKSFIANCDLNCKECNYCEKVWNTCLTTY